MAEQLPPHDDIDLALEDLHASLGASGSHGLLSGLACAGRQLAAASLRSLLNQELEAEVDDETFRVLRRLDDLLRAQLTNSGLGFDLLLPDDELPLATRVEALAGWCEGFLAGFGNGAAGRRDRELPADVRELLDSIGQIALAEADGEDDNEEGERHYMELVEFLRVAVLTVFLEMAEPRDGSAPDDATMH